MFLIYIGLQTWKIEDKIEDNDVVRSEGSAGIKKVIIEETFHMLHQFGWAKAFPDALGVDDHKSSILGRECARLQCKSPGWHHDENTVSLYLPRVPALVCLCSVMHHIHT